MNEIKRDQRKIQINELPTELPDFNSTYEPKDYLVKKWIINWILSAISKRAVKDNDIIPTKADLSKYLGVSIGTVQNAIRYVEDEGLLKSKQKLGTMISTCTNPLNSLVKSTSKRDKAVLAVKKYIIQRDLPLNKPVPSTRKMSDILKISQNTLRLAYELLCSQGYFVSRQVRGNDANWILIKYPSLSADEMKTINYDKADTLVDIITNKLKNYLSLNFKIGDKIPSHDELATELNVSIKTIHDCVKILNKEGILLSRRGRYGTILSSDPSKSILKSVSAITLGSIPVNIFIKCDGRLFSKGYVLNLLVTRHIQGFDLCFFSYSATEISMLLIISFGCSI